MKYDFLVQKILNEAIGGALANLGVTAIKNQQKTAFDTLAKPGLSEQKGNCINTNKDKNWENKIKVGKVIYVRFADPASAKNVKTNNTTTNNTTTNNTTTNNPPVGAKINSKNTGLNVWDGKNWIIQSSNKQNPASGMLTLKWNKQQTTNQNISNKENLPEIKVTLKITKILGDGKFYADIVQEQRNKYYSKTVKSPTTNISYSKIDIITPNLNVNTFTVLMGKGTMEPNFCFA